MLLSVPNIWDTTPYAYAGQAADVGSKASNVQSVL
jgi:hypothetical protein